LGQQYDKGKSQTRPLSEIWQDYKNWNFKSQFYVSMLSSIFALKQPLSSKILVTLVRQFSADSKFKKSSDVFQEQFYEQFQGYPK